MFYKRISDLIPLGDPTQTSSGFDWSNVVPHAVEDPGITDVSSCYAKSLWFEAMVSKDINGCPTGNKKRIAYFENKRINVYNFLKLAKKYVDQQQTIGSAMIAIDAFFEQVYTDYLGIDSIGAKESLEIHSLTALTANIQDLNVQSLTANIIATNDDSAYIDSLSTDVLNFNVINFTNIYADNINAQNGYFNNVVSENAQASDGHFNDVSTEIFLPSSLRVTGGYYSTPAINPPTNTTKLGDGLGRRICIDNANISEMMKANGAISNYVEGTLVRFGRNDFSDSTKSESKKSWEVTIAKNNEVSGVVNGIVASSDPSASPGILMNYNVETPSANNSYVPIVLAGNAMIRVICPVDRFDKLYLSTTISGVASNVENGRYIAIALEDVSSSIPNEISTIHCATKFNIF